MDFHKMEPGTTIAGRYELLDKLGAGAFGAVYRARQLGIDRSVAIKLLMPDAEAVDSTAVQRFQREAKLSSSLEHPNTITIHDYGQWDNVLYLVMEYVRGESLRELCRREVRLDPNRALAITRQILLSLQEAHSRGIIHRDMKPANIMLFDRVGEKDVVKVLDFGIAKFISNDAEVMGAENAQKDLTVAGRIVGTPRYMAPEQIRGGKPSPASDLYAMGLILFEMLVGQRAVHGESTISLIAMQLSDAPAVDPNDARIPSPLRELLRRATAKGMDERFETAAEFIEAIDAIDRGQLAAATEVAAAAPPPVPGRDSNVGLTPLQVGDLEVVETPPANLLLPILAAAAGVLVLVGLGVGGWFAFGGDTAGAEPTQGAVVNDTAGVGDGPGVGGAVAGGGVNDPVGDDQNLVAAGSGSDGAGDGADGAPGAGAAGDDSVAAANDGDDGVDAVPGEGADDGADPDEGTDEGEVDPTDGQGAAVADQAAVDEGAAEDAAAAAAAKKAAAKKARDKKKKDRERKSPADPPKEKKDKNNPYKPF
jgi:hypothetical protein